MSPLSPKFNYHDKIKTLTELQLTDPNQDHKDIIIHTNEELGEFCSAMAWEDGDITKKHKDKPTEPSRIEALDLAVCALSLFYARGGTEEEFNYTVQKKLNKWEHNLKAALPK